MPGDFSRSTFDRLKHYSGVLMQQGRVQVDADWNEQLAIRQHRTHTEALDLIGACGAPIHSSGFEISLTPDGTDLVISTGRMYVDGLLCESESTAIAVEPAPDEAEAVLVPSQYLDGRDLAAGHWVRVFTAEEADGQLLRVVSVDVEERRVTLSEPVAGGDAERGLLLRRVLTYTTQPDYPNPEFTVALGSPPSSPPSSPPGSSPILALEDGTYIAYVHVWQREVNALDDPRIREVALGGPDTAVRLKTVWQVRLLPVETDEGTEPTCESVFSAWDERTAPSTGMLNARTVATEDEEDLCQLPPSAGFRRLENQLYRVQVHRGGDRDTATFKWSRDNATVETTIKSIDVDTLTVGDLGKDEFLGFAGGQWAEIVDDESELLGTPNPLVQIDSVDPETLEVTLTGSVAALADRTGLKLRRWDQSGDSASADGVAMSTEWVSLEGGIEVQFAEGSYQPGDYWLIPARTATREIDWPPFAVPNSAPALQPPLGIAHHYCRLALLIVTANGVNVRDCRNVFPPLTELPGAEDGLHVTGLQALDESGNAIALANDVDVDIPRVLGGIHVQCDGGVAQQSVSRPTCFLTVELPFNQPAGANVPAAAYSNVTLAANVRALGSTVIWEPTNGSRNLLAELPVLPAGERGYLARLFLKGNFMWAAENPELFLDGEAFGIRPANSGSTALRLPSGNERRGGDFETWFWLRRPRPAGPLVFTLNTLVAPVVRGEGIAEAVTDLVLTATGGTPTPPNTPVPLFTIQVFLNTNVTSPELGGVVAGAPLSDVVLLIDEPARLNTTHIGATAPPPVIGVGGSGVGYTSGAVPNVFIGRRASQTSIIFAGVPIDPPGDAQAGASRVLRIKNLRANASQLGVGTTVPAQVTAFVSISGGVSAPVENPTQQIGFPQAGTVFRVLGADGAEGPFSFSRREGVNVPLTQDPTRRDAVINFQLEFREGFPTAFKVRKQGPGSPTPVRPGEEAGWDNQGPGALPIQAGGPLPPIGLVTSGTRFEARFRRVPQGVRIFVTTRDVPAQLPIPAPDNPPPTAVLTPLQGTIDPVTPDVPRGSGGATGGVPIQELPVVNGEATAVWEWVSGRTSPNAETVHFGVVLAAPPVPIPLPAPLEASVRGNLAPLSTVATAAPLRVPVPRFTDVGTDRPAFRAV